MRGVVLCLLLLLQSLAALQMKPITAFFGGSSSSNGSGTKRAAAEETTARPASPKKKQKALEAGSGGAVEAASVSGGAGGWGPVFEQMDPSWQERLGSELKKPYIQRLVTFLNAESAKHTVFPPKEEVWTALNLCPFDQVKVVIIGQDPYFNPNQAHGLAFSVAKGVQIPPSLRNMIAEAHRDVGTAAPGQTPHGNLECWSKQGVLMLNTCLTVRKGEANSHQKQGWEDFTDAVVRELGKREGIVYLLWGSPAQAKCKAIDAKKNRIIKSSHPSPLAAYKTAEPFMGSSCFSKCNAALAELGKPPIDWKIV